jgi:hypothetical protein
MFIEISLPQLLNNFPAIPNDVIQKLLYQDRHSGLDPESSLFNWIPAFAGMATYIIVVKNC